jgi:putative PIN family toxin of toxin-antitoxin system
VRAVIDTNVLLRALIKPTGSVGPIISRLRDGDYTIVYSIPLIDELTEKMALPRIRHKYQIQQSDMEAILALIAMRGELVQPVRKVKVCRDPGDDMVIEAALAGEAEYVVTGDKDLLVLKRSETVLFVTPRTFLAALP